MSLTSDKVLRVSREPEPKEKMLTFEVAHNREEKTRFYSDGCCVRSIPEKNLVS